MKGKKSFKKRVKKTVRNIIIAILTPIIILAVAFLLRNKIGDILIEKAGSAIVGAKVELDGLDINPFSMGFTWDRLQVTNPNSTMKNVIDTGFCSLDIEIKPLLSKKIIIDNMIIDRLMFNTPRKYDGKIDLPEEVKEKEEPKKDSFISRELERQKSLIPIFNPSFLTQEIDVDKIMDELDFKTPEKAEEVKKQAKDRFDYWNGKIKDNDYERQVRKLNSDLNSINPANIRSIGALNDNINKVNSMLGTANRIQTEFKSDKASFEADIRTVRTLTKDVPKWIEDDYKNALEKASLNNIDLEEIALVLFGENLSNILIEVINRVLDTRKAAKSISDKEIAKESEVKVDKYPHLPTLWIKNISLNILSEDGIELTGQAYNISTDQDKVGEAIVIKLGAKNSIYGNFTLDTILDYRESREIEDIKLRVEDFPITNFNLTDSALLPKKVESGSAEANINLNFNKSNMTSHIGVKAYELVFNYDSLPEDNVKFTKMVRSLTSNIHEVEVEAEVTSKDGNLSIKVDSNLDEILSKEIKKLQGEEIRKAKADLTNRVNKELNRYKDDLNNYLYSEEKKLTSKYSFLDGIISTQDSSIKDKKINLENAVENMVRAEAEAKLKEAEAAAAAAVAAAEAAAAAKLEEARKKAEKEAREKAEDKIKDTLGGFGF